jgi:hypothetical protein
LGYERIWHIGQDACDIDAFKSNGEGHTLVSLKNIFHFVWIALSTPGMGEP